jgi:hypothetical protein
VTGGDVAALQTNATAAIVNTLAYVIAPVHITLSLPCGEQKRQNGARVKRYWETIADNLSKAGWSWGCISAVDLTGRTIWIADAHRDDGNRFVVHANEVPTLFIELKSRVNAKPYG